MIRSNKLSYIYIYIHTHQIRKFIYTNFLPKVWIDWSGYLNGIDNFEIFLWLDYIIILKSDER